MNRTETVAALQLGEIPRPIVELTMDDLVIYSSWSRSVHTDPTDYVSFDDDWTLSADERRTSGERQQRKEDALMSTTGELWWNAMSPTGFGPKEPTTLGTAAVPVYDGTEVITTIPAVDPDEVRVDAGFIESGQFVSKIRKGEEGRMYRDFVGAARFFTVDDDERGDLWTPEGYDWERLETDGELAAELPSFTAYWE